MHNFDDIDDEQIGYEIWRVVEQRIGGESITTWLRARGHGWEISARPKPYALVGPVPGAKAKKLHKGHTCDIRIGHDGTRRGGYLALYRCLDAAVTDLADIAVTPVLIGATP